jgi:non-heme chloroperoxidase
MALEVVLGKSLLVMTDFDETLTPSYTPGEGMMGGAKAHRDGIRAFSETDFTKDLRIIDVPTLVVHGDDDQIVPIAASALLSGKLLKKSTLKIYEKFPHGRCMTPADVINADLLALIKR